MTKKKQSKKKSMIKKVVLLVVAIAFVAIIVTLLVLNNVSTERKLLAVSDSLITKQEKLEEKFTSKGYTLENPNIIVDPYDNSPLTALVIFETKDSVAPKVTIKGKDKLTTYTHEFEKETTHYLPIYGLYPGKENTVVIEYGEEKQELKIKTDALPEDFI